MKGRQEAVDDARDGAIQEVNRRVARFWPRAVNDVAVSESVLADSPRPFFWLAGVALALAAALSAGLVWDGSYVVYMIVIRGAAFANNHRYSNALLQGPTVIASKVTSSLDVLSVVFSASYAAIPLISLLLSWAIVRKKAPWLFVWPVLAMGLGTAPGQMCFVCDAVFSSQLVWPPLLAILIGSSTAGYILIAVISAFIFFLHPVGALLFATMGGAAVVRGRLCPQQRSAMWMLGTVLVILAAARMLLTFATSTAYEESQMSLDVQLMYFREYVLGLPLAAVVSAWLSGAFLIWSDVARARATVSRLAPRLWGVALALVALGGIALVLLAIQPALWHDGLSFRGAGMLVFLPVVSLTVIDVFLNWSGRTDFGERGVLRRRYVIVNAVGGVFAIMLAVQSVIFWDVGNDFKNTLAEAKSACVGIREAQAMIEGTALDHWSLPLYALMSQGTSPTHIVLDDSACSGIATEGKLRLPIPWEQYYDERIFNLVAIRNDIAGMKCSYVFSEGWYDEEHATGTWWRWTAGRGVLSIRMQDDGTVRLRGGALALKPGNSMEVVVNGRMEARLDLGTTVFGAFEVPGLHLRAGDNRIEFVSAEPPDFAPNDSRPLAIAVSDVTVDTGSPALACGPRQ